jgi:hypothetical protein
MLRIKKVGRLQVTLLLLILIGILAWTGGGRILATQQENPEVERRMKSQEDREANRAVRESVAMERRLTIIEVQMESMVKMKDMLTTGAFSALGILLAFLGRNIWNATISKRNGNGNGHSLSIIEKPNGPKSS